MVILIILILWGYSDWDWDEDMNDRKNTASFIFYIEDTSFTLSSKKQSTITLSTCETEYITITSCVCHSIWLRRLLKRVVNTTREAYKDLYG